MNGMNKVSKNGHNFVHPKIRQGRTRKKTRPIHREHYFAAILMLSPSKGDKHLIISMLERDITRKLLAKYDKHDKIGQHY